VRSLRPLARDDLIGLKNDQRYDDHCPINGSLQTHGEDVSSRSIGVWLGVCDVHAPGDMHGEDAQHIGASSVYRPAPANRATSINSVVGAAIAREAATEVWKSGDVRQAIELFELARQEFPIDAETYVLSGELATSCGDDAQASEWFTYALGLMPDHRRAQRGLLQLGADHRGADEAMGRRGWLRRR
jgi:TolA-binding protein